jgi:periplasmic protein TonB
VTALLARLPTDAVRGRLGWILPGSVALHVIAVAVLPSAERAPSARSPVVIEMIDPPAPEPPRRATPEPEPAPSPDATLTRATPTPASARVRPSAPAAASDRTAGDSPVDFTSAVMSNDGPGLAIGAGGSGGEPRHRGTGPAGAAPAPAAPLGPRVVLAKDLSRLPRAPGLDGTLEQHYPAEARRSGISGKAILRVMILPDGRVGVVRRVEESRGDFAEACEKAVRSSRWEPPIDREGAPVATEITYTCRFEIRG